MTLDYYDVLEFASNKHEGQFRKDGVTPYINHPIKVAELVKKYKGNSTNIDAIVAAALLHDTLEDTYTSYKELKENFGDMVASMVLELTSAKVVSKLMGKGRYLKHKMKYMSPYALVIKLADRLANIFEIDSMNEERQISYMKETREIVDFLETQVNLNEYETNLITAIKIELDKFDNRYYYCK